MDEGTSGSLSHRLNRLFATVHPRDRGPYSNEEVARAVRARGGDISKQYIAYLRKGERDNPRMHHLKALAQFFGVPASYFFDEVTAGRVDAELDRLGAPRDTGSREGAPDAPDALDSPDPLDNARVTRIAMRAVGLSPAGLGFAEALLDRLRELEGLPPEPPAATPT